MVKRESPGTKRSIERKDGRSGDHDEGEMRKQGKRVDGDVVWVLERGTGMGEVGRAN